MTEPTETTPAQAVATALAEADRSATDLGAYVGAHADHTKFVASCWDEATELVAGHLGTVEAVEAVPATVVARAVLEVGSELYHRRNAPGGVAGWADEGAAPVRVARDPLTPARPILAAWVAGGFA